MRCAAASRASFGFCRPWEMLPSADSIADQNFPISARLGISAPVFLEQLRGAITNWTLWIGVIKAPVFAAIIAMVGCYEGFNVSGSAESVGRLTTQ